MTSCELATIVQEDLDVKIAVINNGYLGMVRQWQEFFYDRRYNATPLVSPDFAKLAEALRHQGHRRCGSRSQVVPAVQEAREHRGPCLINFQVEKEDTVYPMVPAGADLHEMIRRPGSRVRRRDGEVRKYMASQTFVVYVENKPGVLNRVASLFRRRAFNIESLTVGHTERRGRFAHDHRRRHRHTRGAPHGSASLQAAQRAARAEHDGCAVDLSRDGDDQGFREPRDALSRSAARGTFRARVVDVAPESIVIEITGTEDKIDGLLDVLQPYGVIEMVRTGRVAMARGSKAAQAAAASGRSFCLRR